MTILPSAISVVVALLLGMSEGEVAVPKPVSSAPVQIPADFCFGYVDTEKTCSAKASFTVTPNGAVEEISIVESSRNRDCDRAVMHSLHSRHYSSSSGFVVSAERVQSQTCRALYGR